MNKENFSSLAILTEANGKILRSAKEEKLSNSILSRNTNSKWNRRGLSPVIATILLIAIVIVIGVIIFLWARSFFNEQTEKFDQPVERACPTIKFEAEAAFKGGKAVIDVVNQGTIPLYGLEVRKVLSRDVGSIQSVGQFEGKTPQSNPNELGIGKGETGSIEIGNSLVERGDNIEVRPIIIGEKGVSRTPYTCDKEYGRALTVI